MRERLSDSVPSIAQIRRQRLKASGRWWDRLARFRRDCTPRKSFLVALCPLLAASLAAFGAGRWYGTNDPHLTGRVVETAMGLAAVLAGIAGFLLAAFIFLIGSQTDQAGDLRPLVAYVLKRDGLTFDAAFVVGTIGAISTVAILVAIGLPVVPTAAYAVCLALALLSLGIALWHLGKMVLQSTDDIHPAIRSAFLPLVDDVLDADEYMESLRPVYMKKLRESGLIGNIPSHLLGFARRENLIEFKLSGIGFLWDVSLGKLRKLQELLEPYRDDWEFEVMVEPGNITSGTDALLMQRKVQPADSKPPPNGTGTGVATPDRARIQAALDQAFIIQPRTEHVGTTFSEAVTSLLRSAATAAKTGDPDLLQRRLEIFGDLLARWRSRSGKTAGFFGRAAPESFLFPPSIRVAFNPVVRAAADSRDGDTVSKLGQFFVGQVGFLFEQSDRPALAEMCGLVAMAYSACAIKWEKTPEKQREINNIFGWLCVRLTLPIQTGGTLSGEQRSEMAELVIAGVARMIKAAIDLGRADDAETFFTQLYPDPDHYVPRSDRGDGTTEMDKIGDILDYACIGIAGWCVRRITQTPRAEEAVRGAASAVLAKCVQRLRSAGWLLGIWEWGSVKWEGDHWDWIGSLRTRLGFDVWEDEEHDPGRPGVIISFTPDYHRWVRNGLLVLMLAQFANPTDWSEYPAVRIAPDFLLANPNSETEKLLKDLTQVGEFREFMGKAPQPLLVENVMTVIRNRELQVKRPP